MHGELIAAVDFGSKKLSASLGLIGKEELEIYGTHFCESMGIEKGFITNEVRCEEALNKLLSDLQESTRRKVTHVFVGISNRGLRLTEVSAKINLNEGKVTNHSIEKIMDKCRKIVTLYDGEEFVDCIVNYFSIDNKVVDGNIVGWHGSTLEVNSSVIVGPMNELEKFKNVVKNLGYVFEGFLVNVVSGRKAFLEGDNSEDLNVLVDVGAGTTDMAIFNKGVLKYIDNIPVGGNNITRDLSICGEISLGEAENIKIISSSSYENIYNDKDREIQAEIGAVSISKELLYEVIKARIEEILKITHKKLKNSSYFQGFCSIIFYGDALNYFENINSLMKNEFSNKIKVVTKKDLGMKNSSNITSLVILKDVFDRFNILSKDIEVNEAIEIEKKIEEKLEEKIENEKISKRHLSKKAKEGFMTKIKGFLRERF